jgi:hypothetical protein
MKRFAAREIYHAIRADVETGQPSRQHRSIWLLERRRRGRWSSRARSSGPESFTGLLADAGSEPFSCWPRQCSIWEWYSRVSSPLSQKPRLALLSLKRFHTSVSHKILTERVVLDQGGTERDMSIPGSVARN